MTNIVTEYVGNTSSFQIAPNHRWWLEPDKEIYQHAWQVVNNIDSNQIFMKSAYARFASLYSNLEYVGQSNKTFSRTSLNSFFANRLSLNVVKACTDTAASKIAKNKPRPLFLTSDGNFGQQSKAKKLTKYMEGLFDNLKVYEKGQKAFVDGCIFGIGILKAYIEDSQIKVERVLPEELAVDEQDAIYNDPQQIHQTKYISRDILVELFPGYAHEIMGANSFVRPDMAYRSAADQIAVRESWHLKSGKEAKDGKHVIYIDNCTLFAEEYTKDYFPFIFFRWNPRLFGFFGMGIAEELVGIQNEITKIVTNIQRSIHLVGVPRIWVESGSGVNKGQLNNEPGMIHTYKGTPPIFQTAMSMSPDVYQYLENWYKKAFEITGISLLSATSQKPAGITAAVALREVQDIESERFQLVGQRYENSYMDLSRICIDLSRDLYTNGTNLSIKVKKGKFIEEIKWGDVGLEDDQYILRTFPTSLLPSQPQGRLQQVQELVQAGFMSKEDAESLLDFPDLEGFISLQTAAKNDIMMLIEKMLEDGEYQTPDEYMNLDLAIQLAQSSLLKARAQNAPEDRQELLINFMASCAAIKQQMTPPAPQPQPPQMEGAGQGAPQPSPQSELIPNAPVMGA